METQEQVTVRLERERLTVVVGAVAQARAAFDDPADELGRAQRLIAARLGGLNMYKANEREAVLAIIAGLGEVFRLEEPMAGVEAFSGVLINAAWLAAMHRMGVGPIFDLARVFIQRGDTQPLEAAGRLADVVLQHGHMGETLYRTRVADALAYAVAKGLDDCELLHEIQVKTRDLFLVAAKEMETVDPRRRRMAQLNDSCPPTFEPEVGARAVLEAPPAEVKERALLRLQSGVDVLAEVASVEPGDFCAKCGGQLSHAADTDVWSCPNGHEISNERKHRTTAAPSTTEETTDV